MQTLQINPGFVIIIFLAYGAFHFKLKDKITNKRSKDKGMSTHDHDLYIYGVFVANVLGYGGGPASIPLMFEEVVNRYSWLSNDQFSNMLALANALPYDRNQNRGVCRLQRRRVPGS